MEDQILILATLLFIIPKFKNALCIHLRTSFRSDATSKWTVILIKLIFLQI